MGECCKIGIKGKLKLPGEQINGKSETNEILEAMINKLIDALELSLKASAIVV